MTVRSGLWESGVLADVEYEHARVICLYHESFASVLACV